MEVEVEEEEEEDAPSSCCGCCRRGHCYRCSFSDPLPAFLQPSCALLRLSSGLRPFPFSLARLTTFSRRASAVLSSTVDRRVVAPHVPEENKLSSGLPSHSPTDPSADLRPAIRSLARIRALVSSVLVALCSRVHMAEEEQEEQEEDEGGGLYSL